MKRRDFLIAPALLAASCAAPSVTAPPAVIGGKEARIRVSTVGSGPDVVLIPGLSSSPEVWKGLTDAVPGYRYHLVHVVGFAGLPPGGNAGHGPVIPMLAESIARYIESAKLDRPALIGHSMGGTLGMLVAARHPDLPSKLMVVDMVPFLAAFHGGPTATLESVRPIADQIRNGMINDPEDAYRKRVETTINGMIKTESLRARPLEHSLASDRSVSGRAMHDLITSDFRPELGNIKVPVTVLYVRAPNVPITDEQMDAGYKFQFANLPQAKLKRIPDAWHFIMFDQPEVFHSEVRSFLASD